MSTTATEWEPVQQHNANDWEPAQQHKAEDWEPVTAPSSGTARSYQHALPTYEPWIKEAVEKYQVPENALRTVLSIESAGGRNPGTSSAGAYGPMQLMPDTAKGLGVDIKDPHENFMGGARYLKGLIDQFGGNARYAAAAYNAGPNAMRAHLSDPGKNPLTPETQNYLASFDAGIHAQGQPAAVASVPPATPANAAHAQAAHREAGIGDAVHALADATKSHGPLDQGERHAHALLIQAMERGEDTLDAGLNFAQRLMGGTVTGMMGPQHMNVMEAMGHGVDLATHPNDHARQAAYVKTLLDVTFGKLGLEPATGDTSTKAKFERFAETFAAQTLTDPLTYVPILGEFRAIARGSAVLKTGLKLMDDLATQVPGMKQMMNLLHTSGQSAMTKAMSALDPYSHNFKQIFGQRPELDTYLNAKGKAARISIEHKWQTKMTNQGLDPLGADIDQYKKLVNKDSNTFLNRYSGWQPGLKPTNKQASKLSITQMTLAKKLGMQESPVASGLQTLAKESILGNPLVHGLKNVGMLAYLKGGPEAFFRGVANAIHGVDPSVVDRLTEMGAHAEYTRDLVGPVKNVPILRDLIKGSQTIVNRLEGGYRSAILTQLDRKMGGTMADKDLEYIKGQQIRDALGDYQNTNLFTTAFDMLGGPFVAFRLGIVPKAVIKSFSEHPGYAAQIERVRDGINAQLPAGDQIHLGGPLEDFSRMVTNPGQFFTSPSTAGAVGLIRNLVFAPGGLQEKAGQFLYNYAPPFLSNLLQFYGIPYPAPGMPKNFDPKNPWKSFDLRAGLAGLLGTYFARPVSHKKLLQAMRESMKY